MSAYVLYSAVEDRWGLQREVQEFSSVQRRTPSVDCTGVAMGGHSIYRVTQCVGKGKLRGGKTYLPPLREIEVALRELRIWHVPLFDSLLSSPSFRPRPGRSSSETVPPCRRRRTRRATTKTRIVSVSASCPSSVRAPSVTNAIVAPLMCRFRRCPRPIWRHGTKCTMRSLAVTGRPAPTPRTTLA